MTNYSKIVENIEADIGESLNEGDYIPSFSDIMKRFKVSKITAQTAVKHLKDNGSVSFLPGKGYRVAKRSKQITIATYACYRPFNLDITHASTYNAFADECSRRKLSMNVIYSDAPGFNRADDCILIGMFDPKDIAPFAGRNAVLVDAVHDALPSVSFDMPHACRIALEHAGDVPLFLVLPPSTRADEIRHAFDALAPKDLRAHTASLWYDEEEAKRIMADWRGETIIAFNNIEANLLLRTLPAGSNKPHMIALKKSVNEIGTLVSGILPQHADIASVAVECIVNERMKKKMEIHLKGEWIEGET
ncbi:MAG: GntR family transcriptional regulator [Spirochaetota bacterium]